MNAEEIATYFYSLLTDPFLPTSGTKEEAKMYMKSITKLCQDNNVDELEVYKLIAIKEKEYLKGIQYEV